jgi:hypothetical protein
MNTRGYSWPPIEFHAGSTKWRRFWIALAAAVVLWIVIARFAFPQVTRDGALILIAFGLVVRAVVELRERSIPSWIEPATPEALGATRFWIALILLASVIWEDLPSSAYLPRGMLDLSHSWLVSTLYSLPIGFDRMLASPAALRVFEGATTIILSLAAIGFFTRWTVPLGAVAYMVFAAIFRSYSWSYHTGIIPLYALFLLSFTPCGDGLSVDRWMRMRRGRPVPPAGERNAAYGLGRYLIWMGVAIPYTLAGMSKIRNSGLMWWRGEHLKQMVLATVVEPMHFDFQLAFRMLHGPTLIFDMLGLIALLTELTFVLVLVSRLARKVLPLIMAGTHIGILFMQNILFPDLVAVQAIFYDWTPVFRRLRSRASERIESARDISRTVRIESVVARAFLVVVFVVWSTRTEKFPLTAMQMFSRSVEIGPVVYVRPVVYYEDGTHEQARFERWIGAVSDTRYRRLLRDWDARPERIALLHQFLSIVAARANASAPPGRRIDHFELEMRKWDFRKAPDDPDRGQLVRLVRHDVAAAN